MATWMLILVAAVGAAGVAVLVVFSLGRVSGRADLEEERLISESRHALREAPERSVAEASRDDEDDDNVEALTST